MNISRDDVTFGLALLGAALGLLNTWRAMNGDRVRLRVTPRLAQLINLGDDRSRLCIEIVNLSNFPVTVGDAGFMRRFAKGRLIIISPFIFDGKPWPRRLEPRSSVTVYCAPELLADPKLLGANRAYVKTDCGETFYGTSKALKQVIADLPMRALE